jgi:hypothetical protein
MGNTDADADAFFVDIEQVLCPTKVLKALDKNRIEHADGDDVGHAIQEIVACCQALDRVFDLVLEKLHSRGNFWTPGAPGGTQALTRRAG